MQVGVDCDSIALAIREEQVSCVCCGGGVREQEGWEEVGLGQCVQGEGGGVGKTRCMV